MKKTVKTTLICLLMNLAVSNLVNAQIDTIRNPIFDLTFDVGVFYPRNVILQEQYNSKSAFNWSIGARFGGATWFINPWIKYKQYKLKIDSLNVNGEFISPAAKRNQLSFGLVNPIPLSNKSYIQIKSAISYNFISEDITDLYSEPFGFIFTVGYMWRLSEFSFYTDFGYDYVRVNEGQYYGDWSGLFFNTGISFIMDDWK